MNWRIFYRDHLNRLRAAALARRFGPDTGRIPSLAEIEAKLARARAAEPDPGRCCDYCEAPAADDWHGRARYCSPTCAKAAHTEDRKFIWRRQDLSRPPALAQVEKHKAHQRRYKAARRKLTANVLASKP